MYRWLAFGFLAVLAAATAARAQTSVGRGRYLVDTVMTCQNCHTPKGPNGPQFDKALPGGLRFDEPAFDVTASNITPDRDTGIGSWSDADIRVALLEGTSPAGHRLASVMPSGYYKILTPGDLDGIVAYLRSVPPVKNKVPKRFLSRCSRAPRSRCPPPTSPTRPSVASILPPSPIAWSATRRPPRPERASTFKT